MGEWLFGNGGAWFAIPALIGTGLFLIRLTLMITGLAGHGDLHADFAGDLGSAHADVHTDSTSAFKALSVQGIAAFIMGFGWAGLACLKGSHLSWATSIAVACAAGISMLWLLAFLLKSIYDLQVSGTLPLTQAVGAEGDVYVSVPAAGAGRGQVRLVVDSRERFYNAVASDEPLPTRTRVRVIGINPDNTVTVIAV